MFNIPYRSIYIFQEGTLSYVQDRPPFSFSFPKLGSQWRKKEKQPSFEETTSQKQNHEKKANLLTPDQWLYSQDSVTFWPFQQLTICGNEIREMKVHSASKASL